MGARNAGIRCNMVQSSLDALKEEYRQELPKIIGDLAERLRAQLDVPYSPEAWSDLHRAAHGLAGTSATFGFLEISERARDLEAVIKAIQEEGAAPAGGRRDDVLGALDSLLGKSSGTHSGKRPLPATLKQEPQPLEPIAPAPLPADHGRLVYIAEDDPRQAKALSEQLRVLGYNVASFQQLGALGEALNRERPDMLIADVVFPEGDLAGPKFIARCQATLKPPVPVIFTSVRGATSMPGSRLSARARKPILSSL